MTEQQKADIYTQYAEKVRGYIVGKTNNSQLAEDLCSDVFIKVYEKIDSFDPTKSSVSTWIFTITRNTLIDYYRTRRVFSEVPEELEDDQSIEDDVCNQEQLEILAKALEHLDERQRNIIVLRYYSGKTLKEIAQTLDISYAYVKILHNKALGELKAFF